MKNYSGNANALKFYISATVNTKVMISVPLSNYLDSIYVPKDSVEVFSIPLQYGNNQLYDSIMPRGVRITSDYPVSISAMNLQTATTDASIVLPTVNIPSGANYVIGTPNGGQNQIMLVSSTDSSMVTIIPMSNTSVGNHPANTPYTKRLNKGEIYQIGASTTLNGSIVRVSNGSKVAVFAGDVCSNWPCGACDHQFEQIMPNQLVDTAYYVPPHFGHTNGYYLKLVPLDSSTTIQVNNRTYSNLNRFSYVAIDVKGDSGYYIRSTKPFHVFQFLKGANCNGYITSGYGDPAMLEILSNKYMGQSAMFSTVNSTNLRDHFVSIVINTNSKNNVYFDRTKVDSSEFKPFPYDITKSYACLKITLGTHLVECAEGMLAYCYGIGQYESYLYLAGFNLPNFDLDFVDSVVMYDCKNQTIDIKFTAKSERTLKTYKWSFGDNTTGTGLSVVHRYDTMGYLDVKLVGEDFTGRKDSVTKKVRVDWPVFDPVRNKIICGIDTVTFEVVNPFFDNIKWHDSTTERKFRAWDNTNVWVYATDTSGYCKFVDTGIVGKINIFSNLKVDSLDKCFKFNRFRFTDSTKIFADQIDHKAWVFPFATYWDQNSIDVKFPMPGKYKVYFDVYTKQVNCKARYPIDVVVHPTPKPYTNLYGDMFCSGTPILFKDSSQIVTGSISKVKWLFADSTMALSDSSRTWKSFDFDPSTNQVTMMFRQIPISDQNCTDTLLSAVNIWPKPVSGFSISTTDTIKCLPAARWTYTSTTKTYFDTFSLSWDAGNGVKGTGKDMRNIRYFNPGIYKVKLIATENSIGCKDSTVKFVEVLSLPKARFNIDDSIQCYNGHYFNYKDSSDGKYLNRQWTLGNNTTDTGQSIDSIRYPASGDYEVKLVVSNQYASCIDSVSKQIHILSSPEARFASNQDTQCLNGNSYNFSNNSVFYQKYKSSNWSFVSSLINIKDTNFNQLARKMSDTGLISVALIVEDEEGCKDTAYKTILVTSHTSSPLSINDTIQCQIGNRFVFRTTIGPGETRNWKIDNLVVQSGSIDSLIKSINSPGLHKVSVVGMNSLGCGDSTEKSFTVLPKPIADFNINNDSQCLNLQSFILTNTSTAADDVINTYDYTVNDTLKRTVPNPSAFGFANPGRFKATLIITTEESCKDTINKYLTALPLPTAFIFGDTICIGDTAELSANQLAGNTIVDWKWDLGDGNNVNGQSVRHAYSNTGTYSPSLNIKDIFDCENTATAPGSMVVNELPNPAFLIAVSDFGFNQSKVQMRPSSMGNYQYRWLFPNGETSDRDTPSLYIKDLLKGDIKLILTNSFGCIDSSDRNVYVYPNNFNVYIPSAISFNDDLLNDVFKPVGLGFTKSYEMHIYNRWGEEIFYTEDPEKGWDGKFENQVVMPGIYTYLIQFQFVDGKKYRYTGTLTVLR